LLANDRPYTLPLLNSSFQDLQEELVDRGVQLLVAEAQLEDFPAVDSSVATDPATQVWIGYEHCYDGVNQDDEPVLPADLLEPLRLWERQAGTTQNYVPMRQMIDGLPSFTAGAYLRWWEWRQDKLYFIGSMLSTDIRMRYLAYLADLTLPDEDASPVVPIIRSKNALAYLIAAQFAASRGSALAQTYRALAGEYIDKMCNRSTKRKQRAQIRRRRYGSTRFGSNTPTF
jgi:hypothetical protein